MGSRSSYLSLKLNEAMCMKLGINSFIDMSIRLIEREWNLAGGARIRVRGHDGIEHSVEVLMSATVLELKNKLGEKIGVPAPGLMIMLGDAVLEDNMTLEAAHVQENIALKFEIRSTSLPHMVNIAVTLPSGQTVRVSVPENGNLEQLKATLREKESRLRDANFSLKLNDEDVPASIRMRDLEREQVRVVSMLDGGLQ